MLDQKVIKFPKSSFTTFLTTLKDVEKASWDNPDPEPTNIELKDMLQVLTLQVSRLDSLLRQTFEGHVLFKGRWIPLENFVTILNKEKL